MGNNRTGANQRIKTLYSRKSLDSVLLYNRAKLLLEVYRDVCWDTADYAESLKQESIYDYGTTGSDLNAALSYLADFAPDVERDRFAAKVQALFEVKWMIEIVDHAVAKVHSFPVMGDTYCSILNAYYLSSFPLSEAEMLDQFSLERSTFYRKKKEAIMVFGLAIWGGSIEEFKSLMLSNDQSGQQLSFSAWM